MKNSFSKISDIVLKNGRLIVFILTLTMFALAAGAPEFIGTIGH